MIYVEQLPDIVLSERDSARAVKADIMVGFTAMKSVLCQEPDPLKGDGLVGMG